MKNKIKIAWWYKGKKYFGFSTFYNYKNVDGFIIFQSLQKFFFTFNTKEQIEIVLSNPIYFEVERI